MIHEALLTDGFQFLYTFKYSDEHSHRKHLKRNISLITIEFIFAFVAGQGLIERNQNLCPALLEGLQATQRRRLYFTLAPYCVGVILLLVDSVNDGKGNANRSKHAISRYIRPYWLIWEDKRWDKIRIAVSSIAIIWSGFSILNLEVFIIYGFHLYMRQFSSLVSSSEDSWNYGQLLSLLCALLGFGYALRTWFISYMQKYVGMSLDFYELSHFGSEYGASRE